MKLEEKISQKKIVYMLKRASRDAFRLALYYFISAKRKKSAKQIIHACQRSQYWLVKAGQRLPESLTGVVNPYILLRELEQALVSGRVDTRLGIA